MKISTILSPICGILLFFLCTTSANAFLPTKHIIQFGGIWGNHYNPSNISVEVGDTIIWNGDFSVNSMHSTNVPPGAQAVNLITSRMSYMYIIQESGTYNFENPTWASLGMRDTITAVFKSHGSLTNEGREFYLGMIYPTYNNFVPASLTKYFQIFALITTYYPDTVYISYYDASGVEQTPTRQVIAARQTLQFPLDVSHMLDTSAGQVAFAACHIVSKTPITVQYLSKGANSGGMYLALPILAVGKNYAIASYNDDAGTGAYVTGTDITAAGSLMVIGTTGNNTSVHITPSSNTSDGHVKGQPFTVNVSKGQCVYIRSDGKDAAHDLSGTLIQASAPVVVISGHEDAYIGDISCYSGEGRNMLIQQLIPVDFWDSIGYMSVPFIEGGSGGTCGGRGDTYRTYTFAGSATIQADVQGIPGGYSMSTSQLNYGSQSDVQGAVDIYSTNGHKISVMQYDERSQTSTTPYPAPTMMAIVPHSRWRTSYNFGEYNPQNISGETQNPPYINVIADSITTILASAGGAAEQPMGSAFVQSKTYSNISTNFPSDKGGAFTLTSKPYFLHSNYPFMCYIYGMSEVQYGTYSGFKYTPHNFEYEYACPAGMELNTGVPPSFKVAVTNLPNCGGWSVSVTDTGSNNPGIKAVVLVDDPAGVYFAKLGAQPKNVAFDDQSPDYTTLIDSNTARFPGELHPSNSNATYTFTILHTNKLAEATAPLGLIDNEGNGLFVRLHSDAPAESLSSHPINPGNPDSIVFQTQTVGSQIFDTIAVHNTASVGGASLMFTGTRFVNNGAGTFTIVGTTPALPASVSPQDSLVIIVSSKITDAKRHTDTLFISTDCFDIPVSLDARGATGTIVAPDESFGNINEGSTTSQSFVIQNTGTAPFTLKPSPTLSDNVNFSIDQTFLQNLPVTIQPGKNSPVVKVYFHPQTPGKDSARIIWSTDIDPSFAGTGKTYTTLKGTGLDTATKGVVNDINAVQNSFSVRPNPLTGNTAKVSFSLPSKEKATVTIYDVLGRELYTNSYLRGAGDFEIPVGFLQQGIYYVRLTSDDIVLTQKLEVQR